MNYLFIKSFHQNKTYISAIIRSAPFEGEKKQGVTIAVEEGGILGKNSKLIIEDDQNTSINQNIKRGKLKKHYRKNN